MDDGLIEICPNPRPWADAHRALLDFAKKQPCSPPEPPPPLILGAGLFSSDAKKHQRWRGMQEWAEANGCPDLIQIDPGQFHTARTISADRPVADYYANMKWGPIAPKTGKPSPEELEGHLKTLSTGWVEIAGPSLTLTAPLRFAGRRARSLIVRFQRGSSFPWKGGQFAFGRPLAFREFRARINVAIAPHHVDHVDFRPGPHRLEAADSEDDALPEGGSA